VQVDYLAKVERAVERWEEVGHCSLNAISWWFTGRYILSVVPDNHPEIISWSNLALGYEGIVPEAPHQFWEIELRLNNIIGQKWLLSVREAEQSELGIGTELTLAMLE
jgi:hypothetical protein